MTRSRVLPSFTSFARSRLFARRVRELKPRQAYKLWAENYPPRAHNILMEVEQRAVLSLLPEVRGRRALDLACGSGRYAQILHERGARVVGIDFALEMLTRAESDFARAQADLLRIPVASNSIEVLVCGLAVGHISALAGALGEMARVLTPGGVAVYSDFHPRGHELGWRREFRATDGARYAVQYFVHKLEAHREAARAANLTIEAICEVGVDEALAQANVEAARFRRVWGDTPVALVIRARKG
jgi:malonyl-CoA O-methyltransferase